MVEIKTVLDAAPDMRLGAAVTLALTTGMRRGEVLGLKWDDLDLTDDPARLRVRRSLQRVNGELVTDDPKSAKGRRTIALPSMAADALQKHRTAQAKERLIAGDLWTDSDFVFATHTGGPIEPRNFHRDWHLPLKAVQETLGHSTIRLTADTYGHLMPEDSDRVAQVVDRALSA